ncbi:MAG: hypothetical protein R3E09_08965 [Novosphingobium sp.]|nr:hypothetical protein [Novosphingobium sp.]
MSSITNNKQNHTIRTGAWPKVRQTFLGASRRKSPELSPSELRGIVMELLG